MAIEFVIDAKDRRRIMKMLSSETASRIGSVMFRAFQQAGEQVANRVRDNISGPILKRPTGRLAGSIQSVARVQSDQVIAIIGSGARDGGRVPYAGIHETGGTIRPKKAGGFLTIPMGEARTAGGDLRGGFTARNLFNGMIPGYETGLILRNIIFGIPTGGKNKLIPLFTLVKSVEIPARHYLSRSLEQEQDKIPGMVIESVARQLREAANGN